jgi:molybdopterin synthase catalytic subunit
MANNVCEILLTESLLGMPRTKDGGDAGAMVEFWGMVRRLEDGREIAGIEYQAHREMAEYQLKRIAEQAGNKFGLTVVTIHHRVGFVAVGEPSLAVAVATPHRSEGFRAAQWIVDELKKKVPIWKKPWFSENIVPGTGDAGDQSKPSAEPPRSTMPATAS